MQMAKSQGTSHCQAGQKDYTSKQWCLHSPDLLSDHGGRGRGSHTCNTVSDLQKWHTSLIPLISQTWWTCCQRWSLEWAALTSMEPYWGFPTRMVYLYYIRGFPTRMVYLYYISCLRYTILVGNPRYHAWDTPFWWEPSIYSPCLQRLPWISCPGHARFKGNEQAETMAGIADITTDLQLSGAGALRGYRNFLNMNRPEHHNINCLKERRVQKGSGLGFTFLSQGQFTLNHSNNDTV